MKISQILIGDELYKNRKIDKFLPETIFKKVADISIISNLEKMKYLLSIYDEYYKSIDSFFHILFFGEGKILPNQNIATEMSLIGYTLVKKKMYDEIIETYYKTKAELRAYAFDNNPTELMKKYNSSEWGEKLLLTSPVLNRRSIEVLIKEEKIKQEKIKLKTK